MMRITLAIAAAAAMLCFNSAATHAQIVGNAPWCAVTETGAGGVERDCEYFTIEQCTPNVIAGNRGLPPGYRPPHHHRRHHPPYH
jgi:hypothetical protein